MCGLFFKRDSKMGRIRNCIAGIGVFFRFGIAVTVLPVCFDIEESQLYANPIQSSYSIQNEWLQAEIGTEDGSYIQKIYSTLDAAGDSTKRHPLVRKQVLHLYKDHPYKSDETFELPRPRRIRQLKDIDPEIPSVHWLSETNGPIAVRRVYAMNATESILHVTTTIENTGVKTIACYPTETAVLDVSQDVGKATPDLYLYMPANAGGSVKLPNGRTVDDSDLLFMPDYNVFVATHSSTKEQAAWRTSQPWFALYNYQTNHTLGFEIHSDPTHLQPVNESLVFQASGGEVEEASFSQESQLEMKHVLGKLTLPPNAAFTYVMKYSMTTCITPIVGVNNGISYVQPFQVFAHSLGFYFAGAMGLPMEGKFGLIYYDEEGKQMRRSHNVYGFNMFNQKHPHMLKSSFDIPAMFSTVDGGFGFTDDNQNAASVMHKTVKKIQLVLLDPETLDPIKIIGEAKPPWQPYE